MARWSMKKKKTLLPPRSNFYLQLFIASRLSQAMAQQVCQNINLRIAQLKIALLGGNPVVGNSESISHQDCPPQLLCFLMNCLCLIWALGECWGLRQCIQSQYFEEQSNSCDYWRHLKTHSGEKSNKCAQWDIAGHLRTCLKTHSEKKTNKCKQCDSISNQAGDLRRHLKTHSGEKSNKCN